MTMIGSISSIYTQKDQALANAYGASVNASSERLKEPTNTQSVNKDTTQSTKVTISDEALKKLGLEKSQGTSSPSVSSGRTTLSAEEQQQVADLKARDQEVRTHEMAHMMVGGSLVRKGASYQYQTGPDGQRYAVGGEVSIDSSAVSGDPTATIRKMEQVKRAALAPAKPSSQDRAVASSAAQTEAAARQELMQQTTSSDTSE
ncbi:SprA-related family protein [bacterium]|nr:SprA-related family protein [bacterium]